MKLPNRIPLLSFGPKKKRTDHLQIPKSLRGTQNPRENSAKSHYVGEEWGKKVRAGKRNICSWKRASRFSEGEAGLARTRARRLEKLKSPLQGGKERRSRGARRGAVRGQGSRVPSYHAASMGPLIFAALRFCPALSTLHTSTADRGHKTLYSAERGPRGTFPRRCAIVSGAAATRCIAMRQLLFYGGPLADA